MRYCILLAIAITTVSLADNSRVPIIIPGPVQVPNLPPPGPVFPESQVLISGTDQETTDYSAMNDNIMDTTTADTGTDQGLKEELPPLLPWGPEVGSPPKPLKY